MNSTDRIIDDIIERLIISDKRGSGMEDPDFGEFLGLNLGWGFGGMKQIVRLRAVEKRGFYLKGVTTSTQNRPDGKVDF